MKSKSSDLHLTTKVLFSDLKTKVNKVQQDVKPRSNMDCRRMDNEH